MAVKRRPTESHLSSLDAAVGAAQEALNQAGLIVSLKDHPGWSAVQGMVLARLAGTERRLEDFEKLTPEQRLLELKARQVLRMFERIVPDFEASLPTLTEALNSAVKARDDYKERLVPGNK